MVVMALPPARGSGGDSSTMSLAVRVSPRRFRAMVISVPIFSVLLRLVFALPRGTRRRDAAVFSAAFSAAFSTWRGCRFPWFRVVWDGLGACFPGLPSGPPEALVCPVSGASPPVLPRGRGASSRPPGKLARRAAFCPFWPSFSGPEGGAGDPWRGEKLSDREKRTCVKKVRGGIQLRVVGFTRLALCNERSFRTDVSICTIFSYGSARACV